MNSQIAKYEAARKAEQAALPLTEWFGMTEEEWNAVDNFETVQFIDSGKVDNKGRKIGFNVGTSFVDGHKLHGMVKTSGLLNVAKSMPMLKKLNAQSTASLKNELLT